MLCFCCVSVIIFMLSRIIVMLVRLNGFMCLFVNSMLNSIVMGGFM